MKNTLLALCLFGLFSSSLRAQQIPDFTLTDVNGQSHSLYADYLDQGKAVFISLFSTWNPFDPDFVESGIMDEFQATYGTHAQVIAIETDPNATMEDLLGTGQNNQSGYDFVTGHDYVIINDTTGSIIDLYGQSYYPWMIVVCPDGTAYTADPTTPDFIADPEVFYAFFESADDIADKVFEHCGLDFDRSQIKGYVYNDISSDCDPAGESGVSQIMATITGPSSTFTRVSGNDGRFQKFVVDEGTYTVEVTPPNALWSVCDNPQSYTFGPDPDSVMMDFGLQANQSCAFMNADISAPFLIRCFDNNVYVNYCNEGTVAAEDVTVEVTLDNAMLVNSIDPAPTSQNGLTYTFDLGTMDIFECGDIVFNITVDCEAELGALQCYSVSVGASNDCNNTLFPDPEECQEIVGSYDPNDKRAYPFQEGDDYTIEPNETIKYMVRFQNTGTFMAFNVEVIDTISPHMDLASLRMGTSSHDYEIFIDEDRALHVLYEDIMLPDSFSNEPASHGFFTYYLDQNVDLPLGTQIENEAAIYFDFNDPVITNTTVHTVSLPVSTTTPLQPDELEFSTIPNPASTTVQVRLDETVSAGIYTILDVGGKKALEAPFQNSNFTIEVDALPKGMYLLQVIAADGQSGVRKLMVE